MYHEILGDGNSLSIEADDGNVGSGSRIQFKVDGSERARINSSGRLGLNTTNPTTDLEVNATGANGIKLPQTNLTYFLTIQIILELLTMQPFRIVVIVCI